MPRVLTGLDRLSQRDPVALALVKGKRVGLLAHAASVDAQMRHASDVLRESGATLSALFGPEHGFAGAAQDMISVGSDKGEGVQVHSLYGETETDLSPQRQWLEGLDAVVIDLQDVGSRYYTYVWTAALMMKVASQAGVECIVLDRPNPIGGERVEGAKQREGYRSFVGLYDIPIRHGLTIAEVLAYVVSIEGLDSAALSCLPMQGWSRDMYWDDTGLPWVSPSPNMPTLDTAIVYPGGCLIEGTLLSEGRGNTRPFEIWGAPGIDAQTLLLDIDGALLRPLSFQPTFQKHAGSVCNGVQVHVVDRNNFAPVRCYLRLLNAMLSQMPEEKRWRTEEYEYVTDRPAIDLLTGGPEFRKLVNSGENIDSYLDAQDAVAEAFKIERAPFLLYS